MTECPEHLWVEQTERLRRFNATVCADVHCHCLPGVDDGPATLTDALALCTALARDGITHVVATPHQLGRYDGTNAPAAIRQAVSDLNVALGTQGIPLIVVPGGDVRIDERLPKLLETDGVLTLADGGRYVLLELPHDTLVDIGPLLESIMAGGRRGILSHPERHAQLAARPEMAARWVERGALMQVTAGSLVGDFGPGAERAGWEWLQKGLVHLIASDAHDVRRRPPRMGMAIDAISRELTHLLARRLCMENPLRVLRGEDVEAMRRKSPPVPGIGAGRPR